jgi:hypothetical protein
VYTVGKMRCYMIAAGTLFSVVAAFGQGNVAPKSAMDGAIHRAFNLETPQFHPAPLVIGQRPVVFTVQGPKQNVCAIPLLEVPVKPTHDRIAHSGLAPQMDPKMARPVGAPPCPKR